MLKNSDVIGLTRNMKKLYSRHMIYSAFLLVSSTFSSVTSSMFTYTCHKRTALHFHPHADWHFRSVLSLDLLLHLSVSCVYPSFFSIHIVYNSRNLSLSAVLPLVGSSRTSRKAVVLLFSQKRFYQTKKSSWWGKKGNKKPQPTNQQKNHQHTKIKNTKGRYAYPLFLIAVLLRGFHSCPDLLISSLFSGKFVDTIPF